MNTVLISILGLLALSSQAFAIVCLPSMCDSIKCQAVTNENCVGKIVPHGGFCRCCDACHTIIKEGENCFFLNLHIRGGPPPTAECDQGLTCSTTTNTCEVPINE